MNNQEITRTNNLRGPGCQLSRIKRNGHTYYGKQNYQCKLCDRQFVERREIVSSDKQELIKILLLERLSLRGICRVLKVSLSWLLHFIKQLYLTTPKDLHFIEPSAAEIEIFCLEADELWSFVERPENKRWIWLVLERRTQQINALHIGDRSQDSATRLWAKMPLLIKKQSLVLTDCWDAYALAIPTDQHVVREKQGDKFLSSNASITPCVNEYRIWREIVYHSKGVSGKLCKLLPLSLASGSRPSKIIANCVANVCRKSYRRKCCTCHTGEMLHLDW